MTDGGDGELIGQRLGAYQLAGLLGKGGMAEVYRARDLSLGREVAVKVLPAMQAYDQGYVTRFRAEARRVAALQHPHIVPVYSYSEHGPLLYLVMPILAESLRDRLDREGWLAPPEATRICQEIATALQAAHEHGLVHRDVKPENVLFDSSGSALLADFGIARVMDQERHGKAETLSSTGLPVGTPEYMAPELLRNEPADARTDTYALGVVLYELLTGHTPHEAETPFEVAALTLTTPIVPPSRYRLAIWPALEEVILTALAAKPNGRFQNVAAFAAALTRALELADSDATVSGRVSALVPAIQRLTDSQDLLERREGTAEASTVAVIPTERSAARSRSLAEWWRAQGNWRQGLTSGGALALLVLTLFGGLVATMAILQLAFGLGHPDSSTRAPTGGVPAATVTAISAALATAIAQHTPGAAATATALTTPHVGATPGQTSPAQPASSPQPTGTTVPGAPLQISPLPLVLAPTHADPETCQATQRIMNTSNKVVGWAWQTAITQGEIHFQLNGQQVNAPPSDSGIAPGGQDNLTITANCTTPQQSFAILVKDTIGNPYTFALTVQ